MARCSISAWPGTCGTGEERLRLFLDFDAMIADAWSIFLLVDEWLRLYRSPGERLPEAAPVLPRLCACGAKDCRYPPLAQ